MLISFPMFPPPLARLTWKRREAELSRASVGGDTASWSGAGSSWNHVQGRECPLGQVTPGLDRRSPCPILKMGTLRPRENTSGPNPQPKLGESPGGAAGA